MAEQQYKLAASSDDLDPDVQKLAQQRVAALHVSKPQLSKP